MISTKKRAIGIAALLLAGMAAWVRLKARTAEARHPPRGRFVDVDGSPVHLIEAGAGPPVILVHGNGAMADDWIASGIVSRLASRYRVIVPDRPGSGHTPRPRRGLWTAHAQAAWLAALCRRLDLERPLVVGHSFGSEVAVALAVEHPGSVGGLVLLSGYYFPTFRLDAVLFSGPALPVIGPVLRNTLSPVLGRLLAPSLVRKVFAPQDVPVAFRERFPLELSLRPVQLHAVSEASMAMVPDAVALAARYGEIDVPVALIAGDADRIVDPAKQTVRLSHALRHTHLRVIPGLGHMVHYFAGFAVSEAVDWARGAIQASLPSERQAANGEGRRDPDAVGSSGKF
jgi:pimeloyl-ACP methyl ester carboxylesterase